MALEVLSLQPRWNRWLDALQRSDRFLTDLEELNLKEQPVSEPLGRSIMDLAVEYNLTVPKRLPRSPSKGLDVIFEVQTRLFRRIRRQRAHQLWAIRNLQRQRAPQFKS